MDSLHVALEVEGDVVNARNERDFDNMLSIAPKPPPVFWSQEFQWIGRSEPFPGEEAAQREEDNYQGRDENVVCYAERAQKVYLAGNEKTVVFDEDVGEHEVSVMGNRNVIRFGDLDIGECEDTRFKEKGAAQGSE